MSNKLASKGNRIFDRILTIGAVFAGAILIFIMLSITLDITLRYTLNRPILWVVETSTYTLVAIAFLPAAWLLKREGHVSMDQLFNRQGPRTQALLNTITSILSTIACLVIVWYGAQVTLDYFQIDDRYYTMLETPKWPISAIVVLGFFLLFIQFIRRTNKYLAAWRGKE